MNRCYTVFNEIFFNDHFGTACRFAKEQVEQLDKKKQWSRALDGSDYLPGMVIIFSLYFCYLIC